MPELGQAFNAGEVEPSAEIKPIPAGWYAAVVVKTEITPTKSGSGKYLAVEFALMEQYHPELKGRKFWEQLNLYNSNQQTVDIANAHFSALCRATVGPVVVTNTDVLHGRSLAVKVKVRKSEEFGDKNEVDRGAYDTLAARFGAGAPAAQAAAPAGAGPVTTDGKPAWAQ